MKTKDSFESVWTQCNHCRAQQVKFVTPGEVCTWKCMCGGELIIIERGVVYGDIQTKVV